MAKLPTSTKRIQINKANARMAVIVAVAAFVVTFSLVASKALWSKRAYQSRVISAKTKALKQLEENVKAVETLKTSYKTFVETPDNVIGGNPKGTGQRDGDNAKIVLDALPSKYDFPALATSLDGILSSKNYKGNLNGVDDELAQAKQLNGKPQPVEMPFQISTSSSTEGAKDLLSLLERSIRPIKVNTLNLSGGNTDLKIDIDATSYYQPGKTLTIEKKVVQ